MTKTEITKIKKAKHITHCYIKKRGGYYRPNSCGYTDHIVRAGVYTKEDALKHYEHCDELTLIPIIVEEHNKRIKEEVMELLDRVICA